MLLFAAPGILNGFHTTSITCIQRGRKCRLARATSISKGELEPESSQILVSWIPEASLAAVKGLPIHDFTITWFLRSVIPFGAPGFGWNESQMACLLCNLSEIRSDQGPRPVKSLTGFQRSRLAQMGVADREIK